jgi:hypothetical protein
VPWAAVPAAVGDLLRGRMDEVVDEVIAAVRAEVPDYDQPLEGEFGRLISQGVSVALGEFADLLGHDAELGHLGTYEALGRAEHRAGRTLDALQSAYRVGAPGGLAADRRARRGRRRRAPDHVPRGGGDLRLHRPRRGGVRRRVHAGGALRASSVQARRQALVELLARVPPAGEAELARAAADAVWTVPARVAALAVAEGTAAALARRMPAGTLGAELPGAGVLVLSDPDGPGQPALVARALGARRGRPWARRGPPEAHLSIAARCLRCPCTPRGRSARSGSPGRATTWSRCLLAGDPALATDLVRERLGPLDDLTPAARERALQTLERGWTPTATPARPAQELHVHPQTVRYRLAGCARRSAPRWTIRAPGSSSRSRCVPGATPQPRGERARRRRPPRRGRRRRDGRGRRGQRLGGHRLGRAARQRVAQDPPHDLPVLARQRPRGVRQPVALADLLHARRQLGVAVARDVREQVVLDLVRQVPGHDVEERVAREVRRAQELAHVPGRRATRPRAAPRSSRRCPRRRGSGRRR